MTDEELRLEAMRLAAQTCPHDVVAEAERIMRFLRPETVAAPAVQKQRSRRPKGSLAADLPQFVALLEAGKSRYAVAKALGYKQAGPLMRAATRASVELPPLDLSNPRVAHGLRMATATNAARRAAAATAA